MKNFICKIAFVLYAIVLSWWMAVHIGPIGIPWCFIIFIVLHFVFIIFPSHFKMDLPEDIEIDYDILGVAGLNQTDSGFILYCTDEFLIMISFFQYGLQ